MIPSVSDTLETYCPSTSASALSNLAIALVIWVATVPPSPTKLSAYFLAPLIVSESLVSSSLPIKAVFAAATEPAA